MKRVLFICSQNKFRSPTAEKVFANNPNLETRSAGLNSDAVNVLTPELVLWAEVIFVMEKSQKNKLQKKFKQYINKQRIICLNIPDVYEFMDPDLVLVLNEAVPKLLRINT
jgi:predicted protein tyrosine phosphatase